MKTLEQVFIILVATLFLAVSIGGAQAGTTIRSSKSNSSFKDSSSSTSDTGNPSPSDATTVNSSKSNSSDKKKATGINTTRSNTFKGKGQDPQTDSINVHSSRSSVYRQSRGDKAVNPLGFCRGGHWSHP